MKRTSLRLAAATVLIALASAGCKENRQYSVTGKVTRGGEPLVWNSDNSQLIVMFVPVNRKPSSSTYLAETNKEEGTYRIAGIPPGEYLVSIQQTDPVPTHDLLNFAYGPSNSPIRKEVTDDGQVIDIDIPAEQGGGGKGRGKNQKEAKEEGDPN
jgi:hypothetical protein